MSFIVSHVLSISSCTESKNVDHNLLFLACFVQAVVSITATKDKWFGAEQPSVVRTC